MSHAFTIKSYALNTLTLTLHSKTLSAISLQLQKQQQQAPELLKDVGVLVDASALSSMDETFLTHLQTLLTQANLPLIGLINANDTLRTQAKNCQLPCLTHRPHTQGPSPEAINKVVQGPVRSGQQIVAEKGDLIIIGSVSAGAELLAAGHIHVYGSLRGKALAGTQGTNNSCIFCSKLAAELVAINGDYQLTQAMPSDCLNTGPVYISKRSDGLHYQSLQPQTHQV